MDEPAGPLGFLIGGAVFSALALFMLSNATTTVEHALGWSALWFGAVLTIAGAVRLGPPARSRDDRVTGPGERRTPW